MLFYNTLNKKKEEFVPIVPGKVSIYVCGPTVYDFIHIGNARPMLVFDTLRRYLEHKGYEVNYVSNFTDVDDKIINKSIEEGIPAQEVAERYIKECKQDMEHMNVRPATTHPRATQEIDGMIAMISDLIEKKRYGLLPHQKVQGVRKALPQEPGRSEIRFQESSGHG